jgi:hypothetical protein
MSTLCRWFRISPSASTNKRLLVEANATLALAAAGENDPLRPRQVDAGRSPNRFRPESIG